MTSSGLVMQITKASGQCRGFRANLLHDLGVDADQVVAAHSGHAGDTGSHDDDIASGQRLVAVRALHDGIETLDRAGLRDVERPLGMPSAMSKSVTSPSA